METLLQYFNDAVEELRQVRWPTRRQAVQLSVIVLGFTGACALLFGLVDFLLAQAVRFLLSLTL